MELNDKQQHILEKALEVFAEKGYDVASVRDVAQRAGVNVAMISYYFGSKEKLLETIFRHRADVLKISIGNIIQSKHQAPQKVDLLIETYVANILNNQRFHQLMVQEQVMLKRGVWLEYVQNMKKKNRALIKDIVAEGQRAGFFRANVDTTMLAVTLFGIINYVFSRHAFLYDEYGIADSVQGSIHPKLVEKLTKHLKMVFHAFLSAENKIHSSKQYR